MNRADLAWTASLAANRVIREQGVATLPVDPMAIANGVGIEVVAKPASAKGVSGMLIRQGNDFVIAYATHIDSPGFQNFSIAHELGHYFLEGHVDAVIGPDGVHHSHAGFSSDDRYEFEADHFAAALLMPDLLFTAAVSGAGGGLAAIESLSALCVTSLTATAIRYAKCTDDVAAVIVSTGKRINYCFMSKALEEIAGQNRVRKGEALPPECPTELFNRDPGRVSRAERTAGESELQDWIGGSHSVTLTEEVVGLGGYGRTLTVLTAQEAVDLEELEEDEKLVESWKPRFRR
jgi:Zn-dependent peptidase ImmA (M78 family)